MENLIKNQTMTSREIADVTGKRHSDLLEAIRKMEPAWVKINQRKFPLVEYIDEKGEQRPMYNLTKLESLYISTKFNDEMRAKLVIRWEELEIRNMNFLNAEKQYSDDSARRRWALNNERKELNALVTRTMQRLRSIGKELNQINFEDFQRASLDFSGKEDGRLPFQFPNQSKLLKVS